MKNNKQKRDFDKLNKGQFSIEKFLNEVNDSYSGPDIDPHIFVDNLFCFCGGRPKINQ